MKQTREANPDQLSILLNFPDAGLVHVLKTGRRPTKGRDLLSCISDTFGNTLLADSMENYVEIILASKAKRWDEAVSAVRRRAELYEMRGDMDYEEFSAWEGPGAGNALAIDIRLAALTRHCFRQNSSALKTIDSVHVW